MCWCDYPQPELFEQKIVRGRKQHSCCECGALISKGTTHVFSKGKWDGDFYEYRQCLFCNALASHVQDVTGECLCFEGLWETIEENGGRKKWLSSFTQ